ncbi:MAG: hypothetical protein AMXMBFR6_21630 [Betaproteobacteria bacterium]|jgi:hypothetical protein|nr:hypothetical protein [Rhodocyclaceae bacterium]MCG3186898.1 hypothetical protein [Rhodocyclaceae bacterium]
MADEDLIARADSLMGRRRSFMPSAPAELEEDLPVLEEVFDPQAALHAARSSATSAPGESQSAEGEGERDVREAWRQQMVAQFASWLEDWARRELPSLVHRELGMFESRLVDELSARLDAEFAQRRAQLEASGEHRTIPTSPL